MATDTRRSVASVRHSYQRQLFILLLCLLSISSSGVLCLTESPIISGDQQEQNFDPADTSKRIQDNVSSRKAQASQRIRMPFISEHPEDVSVRKHEPTTLNCKADGHPAPVIEWYKDGELLRNTGNRMTLSSGSLFFLHVMHNKDTGTYWCTATNVAGTAISKKATLTLPSSSPSSSSSSSSASSSTSSASSSSSSSHHHHQHRKGNRQQLTISSHAPPSGPPSDVSLKVLSKHSALLSWSPPKSSSSSHSTRSSLSQVQVESVTGYSVYVRSLESSDIGSSGESGGASEQSNITTDGSTQSLTLNNLSPSLTYEVFVSAFNQEGSGPPSASLILRTDPMGGLLSRRPKDKISSLLSKDMITSMDPMRQPWWLLVIILLTVMFIFSSGVLIFLMRQRSSSQKSAANNKNQSVQHISLSLPKNYDPANHTGPLVHDSMWIDRSWYNGPGSGGVGSGGGVDQRREQSLLSHHQQQLQNRGVQQPLLGSNSISQQKQSHLFANWGNNAPGNSAITAAAASNASPYDHSLVLDENDSSVYSVIESSHNDYAEVSENQNLSSFRRNQHHHHNQQSSYTQSMLHKKSLQQQQQQNYQSNRNQMQHQQQQERPTTPGPYATTNLINITSNALYRDLH